MFETMVKKQKEIEDLNRLNKTLLSALKSAYKCSRERNHLTKPVLDDMLDAINKAEM